jgi:TonB family protein
MYTLKILLVASALSLTFSPAARAAEPISQCNPQLLDTRTHFPTKSQLQGEHGVVRLAVTLGADGHATAVQIAQSSGYKSLDQAAVKSVRNHWRFDVTHCTAADLVDTQSVDVRFRRAPRHTLASSIDPEAIARTRALAANTQCHATTDELGTAIFACIKDTQANLASNAVGENLAQVKQARKD